MAHVSCPTKLYWEYIRRKASTALSIHLHFGACFAKGCETFRRHYYTQGRDWNASFEAGAIAIIREWGDYEPDIDPGTKTLERCVNALSEYFTEHHPEGDYIQPYMLSNGQPAVELSFAIPIEEVLHPQTGQPLLYGGRYDMLGVYSDQLYVVDEKTSKQLGATWRNQWDMRSQFTGYCWAALQHDHPVVGAVVSGIGLLKTKTTFERAISPRPRWFIDKWYEQLVEDLRHMVEDYTNRRWSQDFAEACESYGGCGIKKLCNKQDPEQWVDQYFVDRIWDPVKGISYAPEGGRTSVVPGNADTGEELNIGDFV